MTTAKHLVESMIHDWINETYAVTHKGQPFAYFGTEAEAKNHMEKYAKKGDASSYKVVKESLEESSDSKVKHKSLKDSSTVKEDLNETESIISKLRDMVNKKTESRIIKAGGTFTQFTLQQASKIVSLYDNQKDVGKKAIEVALGNRIGLQKIMKTIEESLEEASDYKVMHKSFTDAVNTAKAKAEKAGYTIDDDEWFRKVSSGPRKPGTDKTNRYTVELLTKKGNDAKKALQFQVYNTGSSYELNAYIN
jgi:hypothetical protein